MRNQDTWCVLLGKLRRASPISLDFYCARAEVFPLLSALRGVKPLSPVLDGAECRAQSYVEGHRRFPRQIVVYVGREPIRMADRLEGPDCWFRYALVDMRHMDGATLLESPQISDSVIAVLANLQSRQPLAGIVQRISRAAPEQREFYLQALLLLAGLRGLEEVAEKEARNVPILESILDNKVLGREFKRGLQEGRQEGELSLLRKQIEKRFGALPAWADQKLSQRSEAELTELGLRLLDANSIQELLG